MNMELNIDLKKASVTEIKAHLYDCVIASKTVQALIDHAEKELTTRPLNEEVKDKKE